VQVISEFVDDWSKWHVRRSRDRAGTGQMQEDTQAFYETTLYVFDIFLRLIAPIVPFHSEYIWQSIGKNESIHLQKWPDEDGSIDVMLTQEMDLARIICEIGHQIRKTNNQKVRLPLRELDIPLKSELNNIRESIWQIVLDELNIKNIKINGQQTYPKFALDVTDEQLAYEGKVRDIIREVQALRKDAKIAIGQSVKLQVPREYEQYSEEIKKQARISEIMVGDTLSLIS
jgi:isoleucyl-tRNA synthetase